MSAIRGVGKKVSRFFNSRFDIQRATEEAGIRYITKLGTLEDRILAIREMNIDETMAERVDEFINWSAQTWEAAIPYLTAKDDPHLLKKINAYLDNHGVFLRFKFRLDIRSKERNVILDALQMGLPVSKTVQKLTEAPIQPIDAEFSVVEKEEVEEEEEDFRDEIDSAEIRIRLMEKILPPQLAERLNNATILELEDTVRGCRVDMLQDSKLMIAISFGKADVEPAKTYVISKPEIIPRMSRPTQTSSSADLDRLLGDLSYLTAEAQRKERLES